MRVLYIGYVFTSSAGPRHHIQKAVPHDRKLFLPAILFTGCGLWPHSHKLYPPSTANRELVLWGAALQPQVLHGSDDAPMQPQRWVEQKRNLIRFDSNIVRVSTQWICVLRGRAVLTAAKHTSLSGWPWLETLAFRAAYQVAILVKAYVLEGDDGLRLGFQRRHFSILRVDCSLVVGLGPITTNYIHLPQPTGRWRCEGLHYFVFTHIHIVGYLWNVANKNVCSGCASI